MARLRWDDILTQEQLLRAYGPRAKARRVSSVSRIGGRIESAGLAVLAESTRFDNA
jgi:hypothetical protein